MEGVAVNQCVEGQARNELIHLVRKFRWMGMEAEAKAAELKLVTCCLSSEGHFGMDIVDLEQGPANFR